MLYGQVMYSDLYGWAYEGNLDHIGFPMGLVVRDGLLYVVAGRNDKYGWLIIMDLKGFVASLTAVKSNVIKDKFTKHMFRHNRKRGVAL